MFLSTDVWSHVTLGQVPKSKIKKSIQLLSKRMLLTCVLGEALQSWASARQGCSYHCDLETETVVQSWASASAAEQEHDQMLLMCALREPLLQLYISSAHTCIHLAWTET